MWGISVVIRFSPSLLFYSFQAQYNNILYTCKACHIKGRQVVVTPSEPSWLGLAKHAWSGYVLIPCLESILLIVSSLALFSSYPSLI